MNAIQTWKTRNGYTCKVYYDENGWDESPREWDNLGRIIVDEGCKYVKNELTPMDEEWGENLLKWRDREEDDEALRNVYPYVFRLYVLDHSAVAFSIGFIDSPWGSWDCGQIGWIVITDEDAKRNSITSEKQAAEIIESELNTLTQWANGEIYGFIVEDEDGNEISSCWGFYSIEDIRDEWPEVEEIEA